MSRELADLQAAALTKLAPPIELISVSALFDELVSSDDGSAVLPPPLVFRSAGRAEHEILYSQALYTIASKLREGSTDSGPVRLVPMALSMGRLAELMQDEQMVKKHPRDVLVRAFEIDYPASVDMLKQAMEMRSLVIVVEIDKEIDVTALLREAVLEELLTYRLVIACTGGAQEVSLPEPLHEQCRPMRLTSIGLFLNEVDVADKGCKEIFKKMRQRGAEGGNSLYGLVSAIHLANAEIGREATISLQELLMSQACALKSLDLSGTAVDGWSLMGSLRGNGSITDLDVRRVPSMSSLYSALGDLMLQPGGVCRIGYLRCDAFDLMPGEKVLSLKETALGSGAAMALAGCLKHNHSLTDLDLTATDIEPHIAVAIGSTFEINSALAALRLAFNPALDPETKANLRAAADQWKPNLRLDM